MFEVIYLFVIGSAGLPLALTLMQGAGGNHIGFVHRLYRDAAYILAAALGIILFEAALRISLENYWFEELGQSHRYWLSLEYRVGIFLLVSLLVGLFVGVSLRALCMPYAVVPPSAPWIVGFVFAAMVGFLATPLWIPLMRFLGGTPGRRGRSGVRQRSFLLLIGVAALRRPCRNCHWHPLGRNRTLGRHGDDGTQRNRRVRLSSRSIRSLSSASKRRHFITKSGLGVLGELEAARHGSRHSLVHRIGC
jgi:hypothetical protein